MEDETLVEETQTEELEDGRTESIVQDNTQESLTIEDVRQVVSDAQGAINDAEQHRYDVLVDEVHLVGDSVQLLATSQDEEQQEDVTYTVRLDSSQVETGKAAARVLCTEGLLVVLLLSIQVGISGWRLVCDRWRG